MYIMFNSDWKVGSQDILKDITDYRKEDSFIVSHFDWGSSRILPGSYDISKVEYVTKYQNSSEDPKFYLHYFGKVGHTILQSIVPLAWIIKSMPKIKLVINIAEYYERLKQEEDLNIESKQSLNYAATHFDLFFKMLDFYKMDYELVEATFTKKEVIRLSNFYSLNHSPLRSSMIDSFMQVLDEIYPNRKLIEPTRKVYLSRQKTWIPGFENTPANTNYENESEYYFRILKERELEKFLVSNGYDIVCAEDFQSFEEQLMFMASVKELVSTTSSGLNNMLFMHSGQVIVEFFTTLGLNNPTDPETQLHDHYHALAYYKHMTYISLPLKNKNAEWIIDQIKTSNFLKGMISD